MRIIVIILLGVAVCGLVYLGYDFLIMSPQEMTGEEKALRDIISQNFTEDFIVNDIKRISHDNATDYIVQIKSEKGSQAPITIIPSKSRNSYTVHNYEAYIVSQRIVETGISKKEAENITQQALKGWKVSDIKSVKTLGRITLSNEEIEELVVWDVTAVFETPVKIAEGMTAIGYEIYLDYHQGNIVTFFPILTRE